MYTRMIQGLAIVFFLLATLTSYSQVRYSNEQVTIKHVGMTDKPITTVVIVRSDDDVAIVDTQDPENIIFTTNETFQRAADYVRRNYRTNAVSQEFGVFKITLVHSGYVTATFTTASRQNSIDYFTALKNELEQNDKASAELVRALNVILTRIAGDK